MRVLVADDHTLVRAGIRRLLEACADIEVVAETGNGSDVAELVSPRHPDVALLDLTMPGKNGRPRHQRKDRRNPSCPHDGSARRQARRRPAAHRLLDETVRMPRVSELLRRASIKRLDDDPHARRPNGGPTGSSVAVRELRRMIERVACLRRTTLVESCASTV